MYFGRNVKICREQMGQTEQWLAEKADIKKSYISLIERGLKVPSLPVAILIAEALGRTVDELASDRYPT